MHSTKTKSSICLSLWASFVEPWKIFFSFSTLLQSSHLNLMLVDYSFYSAGSLEAASNWDRVVWGTKKQHVRSQTLIHLFLFFFMNYQLLFIVTMQLNIKVLLTGILFFILHFLFLFISEKSHRDKRRRPRLHDHNFNNNILPHSKTFVEARGYVRDFCTKHCKTKEICIFYLNLCKLNVTHVTLVKWGWTHSIQLCWIMANVR